MTIFSTLLGFLVLKLRKEIDWHKILSLAPGFVAGLALGLVVFAWIDQQVLGVLIACYIIGYVIRDFWKPRAGAHPSGRLSMKLQALMSGFTGGVVEGVMGTGGPMLVTYVKAHARSIHQFRATVMCVFLLANILRMMFLGSADFLHYNVLRLALITMPFFMLSMYLGYHVPKKLNERTFHLAINLLLLAAAMSILLQKFVWFSGASA